MWIGEDRLKRAINLSNLRRRSIAPLLKGAALPHIRVHDLRHTCATLLLSKGTHPKLVQELLGHATVAITLDTYFHVMPKWATRPPAPCRTPHPESVRLVSERARR